MKIDELGALVAAMTPGPWRAGSVETYHVLVPNHAPDALGPERVLLRMNQHFPHVDDAAAIAALRNHAEPLLKLAEAVRRYIDVECDGESVETDDHTVALMRGECAGDTHHDSCGVAIAREVVRAALADLEAVL